MEVDEGKHASFISCPHAAFLLSFIYPSNEWSFAVDSGTMDLALP